MSFAVRYGGSIEVYSKRETRVRGREISDRQPEGSGLRTRLEIPDFAVSSCLSVEEHLQEARGDKSEQDQLGLISSAYFPS
jgi:hypothetical protein